MAALLRAMSDHEREEADRLCTLIRNEKDPIQFCALIQQLGELLERAQVAPHIKAA